MYTFTKLFESGYKQVNGVTIPARDSGVTISYPVGNVETISGYMNADPILGAAGSSADAVYMGNRVIGYVSDIPPVIVGGTTLEPVAGARYISGYRSTEPVSESGEPIAEPVLGGGGTTLNPVYGYSPFYGYVAVASVSGSGEPIAEPVSESGEPIAEPVSESGEPIAEPVLGGGGTTLNPVYGYSPFYGYVAVASVSGSGEPIAEPVSGLNPITGYVSVKPASILGNTGDSSYRISGNDIYIVAGGTYTTTKDGLFIYGSGGSGTVIVTEAVARKAMQDGELVYISLTTLGCVDVSFSELPFGDYNGYSARLLVQNVMGIGAVNNETGPVTIKTIKFKNATVSIKDDAASAIDLKLSSLGSAYIGGSSRVSMLSGDSLGTVYVSPTTSGGRIERGVHQVYLPNSPDYYTFDTAYKNVLTIRVSGGTVVTWDINILGPNVVRTIYFSSGDEWQVHVDTEGKVAVSASTVFKWSGGGNVRYIVDYEGANLGPYRFAIEDAIRYAFDLWGAKIKTEGIAQIRVEIKDAYRYVAMASMTGSIPNPGTLTLYANTVSLFEFPTGGVSFGGLPGFEGVETAKNINGVPFNNQDGFNTIAHELGHYFGASPMNDMYKFFVESIGGVSYFTGPTVVALNGGHGLRVDDTGHMLDVSESDLLYPTTSEILRAPVSDLDLAILKDVGYVTIL